MRFGVHACTLALLACSVTREPIKEPLQGTFDLHSVVLGSDELTAQAFIEKGFPGCSWGRMSWTFKGDLVRTGYDVLCPKAGGVEFGCQTRVGVTVAWDSPASFSVKDKVSARSEMVDLGSGALVDTSRPPHARCEVSLEPRTYQVVRVRNLDWDWEMHGEDGVVFRLNEGELEPDFSRALQVKLNRATSGEPQ